ncbi:sugar ABC transporter substrate-binding protein [Thermus sp. LT1-2-5]
MGLWALVCALAALGVWAQQSGARPPYTIGVSNGFIGSEWRVQMLDNMRTVNDEYKKQGLTRDLVIQSANVDVAGQINQIRNLVLRRVQGIIINPNSQSGLNGAIRDAVRAGIRVISVDQEVSAPEAVNVTIDQKEWAKISMRWLAEALGGRGNIVIINGIAGHPANEARYEGVKEVLSQYPNLRVLNVSNADWDQAKGQEVMSRLIASYPNIDGVWSQDGMAEGALRALLAANLPRLPIMAGEARAGYLRLWAEAKRRYADFKSFGVCNPPGVGASGLKVLVRFLQGRKLKDGVLRGPFNNTIYVPIPCQVSDTTLEQALRQIQGRPDTYVLDGIISDQQADSYFE